MGYTNVGLKDKIMEMYPEVERHGIAVSLDYNEEKHAYIVRFKRGIHELATHLDKKDADECMNGYKCVYLGMQIGEFIKNFEEREKGR